MLEDDGSGRVLVVILTLADGFPLLKWSVFHFRISDDEDDLDGFVVVVAVALLVGGLEPLLL